MKASYVIKMPERKMFCIEICNFLRFLPQILLLRFCCLFTFALVFPLSYFFPLTNSFLHSFNFLSPHQIPKQKNTFANRKLFPFLIGNETFSPFASNKQENEKRREVKKRGQRLEVQEGRVY